MNVIIEKANTFDAIVIGSGNHSGWELELWNCKSAIAFTLEGNGKRNKVRHYETSSCSP